MTKTQYFTATSIDGFIADEHNSLDWLFQVGATGDASDTVGTPDTLGTPDKADDPDSHEHRFGTFFAGVGAMAMGSTTYEWVLDHEKLLENPGKWKDYYGSTPCWIFSHRTLPPIPGADLRFVSGDVAPVHAEMTKAADGKNIWVAGGGELVGQFADHGLLDEIILGVAPVMLGAGAPLLPRHLNSTDLTLANVEHDAHFVHLTYTVGGGSRG
jgi:dihydrofolate reductase